MNGWKDSKKGRTIFLVVCSGWPLTVECIDVKDQISQCIKEN